jgi:hypothetical protein
MYNDTKKRKIAIKLESGSTDDEVFVNNTSIVYQLSEEDLCRRLLKMCRTSTDEKD